MICPVFKLVIFSFMPMTFFYLFTRRLNKDRGNLKKKFATFATVLLTINFFSHFGEGKTNFLIVSRKKCDDTKIKHY